MAGESGGLTAAASSIDACFERTSDTKSMRHRFLCGLHQAGNVNVSEVGA